MTKRKSTKKPSHLPDGNVRKKLIGELLVDPKNAQWPIEMRMINCLLKRHNDPKFWLFVSRRHKFQSLRNLLAQEDIIIRCHLEYTKQECLDLKTAQEIKLEQKKVGEDIIVEQAKQTLFDFVNS